MFFKEKWRKFVKKMVLLILVSNIFIFAQSGSEKIIVNNLQKDIKYLSSQECFGRGISHDGIYKAEDYLCQELENVGLKVYKQNVHIKMNIPQNSPVFVINQDTLEVAYDYIPHPFSSSVEANYKKNDILIYRQSDLELIKDSLDLVSISHAKRYLLEHCKQNRAKLILFEENYLLMGRQNNKYPMGVFQLVKDKLPDNIDNIYAKHSTKFKRALTRNVIALVEGTSKSDSSITLSAHYDHMGGLGDIYYPGANDNASGLAVLLSLARYYAENPPAMSLVFCFFAGEEQGLYGSRKYVKNPVFPLKRNIITLNLDMIGSGHDGWGLVAGKDFVKDAEILQNIVDGNNLGKLKLRNNAKNSDHFSFTEAGYKALFLYAAGGKQPYHHPDDILETMDIDVLEKMLVMMKAYIKAKS